MGLFPNDFGPYGKGTTGYIHYMQAFKESQKSGGSGGGASGNSECLTVRFVILAIYGILSIIYR